MNTKSEPTLALNVSRIVKAPIKRVFEAWTTPSELVRWFGPSGWQVTAATIDLRVGGTYQIRFHSASEGMDVEVRGVYREVNPPNRLVFSWTSPENSRMNVGETVVTVDLAELKGSTEVRVAHEGFPSEQARQRHENGWNSSCENLQEMFGSKHPGK